MRHRTRSSLSFCVCSRFTQSATAPRGVTRIEVENFYPFSRFDAKSNHCREERGDRGETDFAGSFREQNYCTAWAAIDVANDDVTETTQKLPQQPQVLNLVSTFNCVGLRETCASMPEGD